MAAAAPAFQREEAADDCFLPWQCGEHRIEAAQRDTNVQVFADSFVALNGRPSQRFIDPDIDLYKEVESFKHKKWVIPFTDEIYGL